MEEKIHHLEQGVLSGDREAVHTLSLIHISEPTRP